MIRVGNYSQIKQQLKAFEENFSKEQLAKVARIARNEAAKDAMEYIRKYPPETYANQPGPYPKRWYERGFGPRWARAGGGIGGRNTSEKLGDNWSLSDQGAVGTAIRNPTTYFKWVHTEATQASVHRRHGWRTDKKLFEWLKSSGTAVRAMKNAVHRILGR